ncbi:ATP-binding protein [uncultured Roseobacter sp.]|uniref:ATP-binding protein n=1 Tax=uncultured Roseobacter sp. TaxID=114847 RepID=UPI00262AE04C|nr:DUF87 domain-containing protein [uncultured Roseobacter sp.]
MNMDISSKIKAITQSDIFAKDENGGFKCGTFVGRPYSLNYNTLGLLVCDDWKQKASGLPQGCFLLAFYKNEESISEALLLRVVNPSKLPNDSEVVSSMVEYYKDNLETTGPQSKLDSFTRYEFSFSGIECRVLGTFYKDEHDVIQFGADLENFYSSHNYEVYKPTPEYLQMIVNFTDKKSSEPFKIGAVRYSSSRRFQAKSTEPVPVYVLPEDFLGKRTAMFGMTRTGKSNSVKKIIQATCQMSDQAKNTSLKSATTDAQHTANLEDGVPTFPVGQIIFDINGEYANPNLQDAGTSISDIYSDRTIRYSIVDKTSEGFKVMKVNFYYDVLGGFELLCAHLGEKAGDYVESFRSIDMTQPEDYASNKSSQVRYDRKVAAYQLCLYKAGFPLPADFKNIRFPGKKELNDIAGGKDPSKGLSLDQAYAWFDEVWSKDGVKVFETYLNKNGRQLFDEDMQALVVFLTKRKIPSSASTVSGYLKFRGIIEQHTPTATGQFDVEIVDALRNGQIVIVDLSQGSEEIQSLYSERICVKIFQDAMGRFVSNQPNNFIQFYFEEAHNLFPKKEGSDLKQIYNRLAKEGAKLNLGMVYATQEVSSISSNILKNTQNWFIAHLNNSDETRELQKYYDFSDFTSSLVKFSASNDQGFVRLKTYSSAFVVPTQVGLFPKDASE